MRLSKGLTQRVAALSATTVSARPFRRTRLRGEAVALPAQVLEGAPQVNPSRAVDPRMTRFFAPIQADLSGRHSAADHAATLALSPRHLSRLCRAETGVSAQAFVEAQKMREACRLPVYTRLTVAEVAFHLGYDDPSYVSRVFQRNLHLSPSRARML